MSIHVVFYDNALFAQDVVVVCCVSPVAGLIFTLLRALVSIKVRREYRGLCTATHLPIDDDANNIYFTLFALIYT